MQKKKPIITYLKLMKLRIDAVFTKYEIKLGKPQLLKESIHFILVGRWTGNRFYSQVLLLSSVYLYECVEYFILLCSGKPTSTTLYWNFIILNSILCAILKSKSVTKKFISTAPLDLILYVICKKPIPISLQKN